MIRATALALLAGLAGPGALAPRAGVAGGAAELKTLDRVSSVAIPKRSPDELEARLRRLVDDAARSDRMRSIVLLHRGEPVLEAHFHGQLGSAPQNLKSITKSLNSLLVGLAIDRGRIAGVDVALPALLPEAFAGGRHADKRAIRLRHLLTMTSGLSLGYGAFQAAPDWTRAVFDAPLRFAPGTRHLYDTPASHLLSAVVARAVEEDLLRFADRDLLRPIGGRIETWRRAPDGVPMGGNDAYLTARDLARIGELMRRGGELGGRRVVSRAWVEASLALQAELPKPTINHGTLATRGYGYLWWLLDFDGEEAFAALGHGGQVLIVLPDRELVVVFTSHWPGPSSSAHYRHLRRLLDEHVLSAFPRRAGSAR